MASKEKVIQDLAAKLEQAWITYKAEEIEKLHNDLVEVIGKGKYHVSTITIVLDILKHEILNEKLKKLTSDVPSKDVFGV